MLPCRSPVAGMAAASGANCLLAARKQQRRRRRSAVWRERRFEPPHEASRQTDLLAQMRFSPTAVSLESFRHTGIVNEKRGFVRAVSRSTRARVESIESKINPVPCSAKKQ